MSCRRLLSFDSHVIDDVVEKYGGEYTAQQVQDVFEASVGYITNLLRYTDVVEVRIPHIGSMVCNVHQMRWRYNLWTRRKEKGIELTKYQEAEYRALGEKIKDVDEYEKEHGRISGHPIFLHYPKYAAKRNNKELLRKAQNIQNEEFKTI